LKNIVIITLSIIIMINISMYAIYSEDTNNIIELNTLDIDDFVQLLHKGMKPDEVINAVGEPNLPMISGKYLPQYQIKNYHIVSLIFSDTEEIRLEKIIYNGADYLSESMAEKVDISVTFDEKNIENINPIIKLYGKIYIPLTDFAQALKVSVAWEDDKGVILKSSYSIKNDEYFDYGLPLTTKQFVRKINKGMTYDEIIASVGKPNVNSSFDGYVIEYQLQNLERLRLGFDYYGNLTYAINNNRINLISKIYQTDIALFDLIFDGEIIKTVSPTVVLQGKTYIPIEEYADIFKIKLEYNNSNNLLLIQTQK